MIFAASFLRQHHTLQVGPQTAELIKTTIGSAMPLEQERSMEIAGRDTLNLMPRKAVVNSEEIREALQEPLRIISRAVMDALEATPPEIGADLIDVGITVVGGGALLPGVGDYLRDVTGLPCKIGHDPMLAVARGTAKFLEDLDLYASFLTEGAEVSSL